MALPEERVEGSAASVAGARWAALKELQRRDPGVDPDAVEFETLEEATDQARVAAFVRAQDEPAEAESDDGDDDDEAPPADVRDEVEAAGEFVEPGEPAERDEPADRDEPAERPELVEPPLPSEWPEEPAERVRLIAEAVMTCFDLEGEIEVVEDDEELRVAISGDDVGLVIGKRGQTIDALQLICGQAAYRDREDRKRVIVDAEGYRKRREEILQRQADQAASEAVRNGRQVELDAMSAQERRVVHTYLKDQVEVETHSEGDEPYRYVVVSPVEAR